MTLYQNLPDFNDKGDIYIYNCHTILKRHTDSINIFMRQGQYNRFKNQRFGNFEKYEYWCALLFILHDQN